MLLLKAFPISSDLEKLLFFEAAMPPVVFFYPVQDTVAGEVWLMPLFFSFFLNMSTEMVHTAKDARSCIWH